MEASPNNHKVSIVIVTCNSLPALEQSLARLKAINEDTAFELIVVDNDSVDESIARVKGNFPQAKVIEMGRNAGFSAACNQAAWVANGEYLLFHNPDLIMDEGTIESLLETWRGRDKVGAVSGRLRFPDGSFQASCRHFPTFRNLVFSRGSIISRFFGGKSRYTLGDFEQTSEVPAVAGTLLMIKRDVFIAHNGFDGRFFMYMEDTDLSLRLKQAGFTNYFVPGAGGIHLWGKGSRGGRLRRNWYHHVSLWKYFLKHFPNVTSLIIMPIVLFIHFVLASCLGRPVAKG